MKKLIALMLCLALALPCAAMAKPKSKTAPAKAAAKKEKTVEASDAAMPVFEPDGSFGFCVLEHAYPDKTKLTLAMSQSHEINLGLTIPDAGFTPGARYDLVYGFDGGSETKIRGRALGMNELLLQFGVDSELAAKLGKQKEFIVGAGDKKMAFALAPMHGATGALSRCIAANKGRTNKQAAAAEQALPEPLKALLAMAGFENIIPVSLDGIPEAERPADFVWKNGDLLGGVREREVPKDANLTSLIGVYVNGLKSKCAKNFKADIGREVVGKGLTLRPAQVSCRLNTEGTERQVAVAILFYLTANQRLTVFTHEGSDATLPAAMAARDSLAKTVMKLDEAAQQPMAKK